MVDTINKYIGNELHKMSDKDLKEVFEQFAHKLELGYLDWESKMCDYINGIIMCDSFDYMGNCITEEDKKFNNE